MSALAINSYSQSSGDREFLGTETDACVHWYAVYTCSRHERWVARRLEERRIEVFLPVYRAVHQWKDRKKMVELALFPGYTFVRINPAHRLRVLQVPGVVRIVSFKGEPAPLPETDIVALRNGLNQQVWVEPHPYLRSGQRVRVVRGPLIGAEGVLAHSKGRLRVVITLEALMRSVAVEIPIDDIEALRG